MTRPAAFIAFLLVAAITLPACSAETSAGGTAVGVSWPQWRGPSRDNISKETGLLPEWPKDGPKLLWKAPGCGGGYASISVADGRIFTTGDRDGKQVIVAMSLDDGKPLWTAPMSAQWDHDPNGYQGARCTPTIDGERVYATSTHGDLVCVEAKSGKEVWHRNLREDFQGRHHGGWGYSESPLVDGDKLVCTPGGPEAGIVALNKLDGKEIWRCAIPPLGDRGGDGAAFSSIVIGNGAGVRQYVQLMGRGVVGVDAASGKFLWGYNRVVNGVANIPTPLVKDDYVFASTGYGAGAVLLKLTRSDDGVKANEEYFLEGPDLQNHHGGMVMVGDYIYCGHGNNAGAPTCLEWKTGKIAWRENHGPGTGSAAVAYADGRLYVRYQNGTMSLMDASSKGYDLKGSFTIPDVQKDSWSHPVILGGKMYLREQDNLLCYDVRK